MSLMKQCLESQTEFQPPDVLLETAIKNIQQAARLIDRIENLSEITFDDLEAISRNLWLTLTKLEQAKKCNRFCLVKTQKMFSDA